MIKIKYFTKIIGVLIFSCFGYEMKAQVYNSIRYSTEDGLAQAQVRAILQDEKGYLWIGTRGGINKFNGRDFVTFSSQTHPGLVGDFINCFYEDQEGTIWIGSERGLSKYEGMQFERVSQAVGSISEYIMCMTGDGEGNIWIGKEGNISIYDGLSFRDKKLSGQKVVYSLLYDSTDNHIWIGTNQGLLVSDPGLTDLEDHSTFLPDVKVYSLLKDRTGVLWIGSAQGIFSFDGRQFEHYQEADGLPGNSVYSLSIDPQGNIWAGTEGGVIYFKDQQWEIPLLDSDNFQNVRASVVDLEGNIWLGLDGGGIQKLTGGIFQKFNVADGLSSNIAKSFLEDDWGRMWISTYDNGVNRYEGEGFIQFKQENGLAGNDISYSFKDSKGNLWFASYYDGLSRYKNGFQNFTKKDGLRSDSIYCVSEDHKGQIWVGTEHGISIFDGHTFYRDYTIKDGLIDNTVYTIYEDREQNVWIGTPEGVSRLSEGQFTNYAFPQIGHTVISILQDPKGRLWFATSEGLYLYVQNDFQQIKISGVAGAHNIVSLVIEGQDYLWVGTENGAYRLAFDDFDASVRNRFEHYTEEDGLPSLECNGNAAFMDSEGNIWLGTTEGAVMRPIGTEQRKEDIPPILHITDVRLSMGPMDWVSRGVEIDEKTGLPHNLRLPYDENRLTFSFIGISLKSPDQVEYKFMIEGVDNSWSEATQRNSITYTNLKPGAYTFRVVAKKEVTAWDFENPTTFSFKILEMPWYVNPRFIILVLLAPLFPAFGIGWIVYRILDKRLEAKREKSGLF